MHNTLYTHPIFFADTCATMQVAIFWVCFFFFCLMNALASVADSSSPMLWLTAIFAAALALNLLIDLWLAGRQIRHVTAHRHQTPAPFAQRISLAAHQKAADYTVASVRLGMLGAAWSALVVAGWTLLGGLDWLNQVLAGWLGHGFTQQLALLVTFIAISSLLDLPWSWYKTFRLEERFGFNKMTLALWLADGARAALLLALLGVPLMAAVLWLMEAAGALWWLWVWGLWTGFNLLMMWLFPTFIAPLFNKFKPLEDEALKSRIVNLMQRSGFSAQGLFVMDGSKRSAHANAYFTGLGNAKRVVFFDTLLNKLDADEVEAVLAHELGHFKHKHIAKRMASFFILSLAGLAVLGWLAQQPWFYLGLGVTPNALSGADGGSAIPLAPNSALALLLFAIVSGVFGALLQPLWAQLSRKHEFEADAYAVAHASGTHLASALLKLYEDNASTLTPDPLYARFHYSHPPASERLARMGHLPTAAYA